MWDGYIQAPFLCEPGLPYFSAAVVSGHDAASSPRLPVGDGLGDGDDVGFNPAAATGIVGADCNGTGA